MIKVNPYPVPCVVFFFWLEDTRRKYLLCLVGFVGVFLIERVDRFAFHIERMTISPLKGE